MTPSRRWIPAVIVAALLLAVATLAVALWTRSVAGDMNAGKARAEAGAKSLASLDATAAISEFGDANRDFASVSRALGPDWVSRIVASVPWAGKQYAAVRTLASIGQNGSLAGLEMAEAIRAPAATTSADSAAVLSSRLGHVHSALVALAEAATDANSLAPDGLVSPLANAVRSVHAVIDRAGPFADRLPALAQLGAYLLSGDHRIVVVSQDGAELRPTGGFAGSFGIVSIGASGVHLEAYKDVYTIPDPNPLVVPPPGAVQSHNFGFRDANWWLDFPTSAKAMLGFWRTSGQPQVDGIVVVDTVVMADLLDIVGPITASRFHETFTPANFLDRLLYLTQVVQGGQRGRKDVLAELAGELEKRVLETNPREFAKTASVFSTAADAKHVQMYFTNSTAQSQVDALGWSGRVAPPQGTTDMVAVSNAMNKPGKVNIAMKKTIAYDVALQPDRSAATTLVLGFANTGSYPYRQLPGDFRDWLRVYRAPGTLFPANRLDGGRTATLQEFGFSADVRTFNLARGQSRTEVLTARVPGALQPASAEQGSTLWYRLYVVRQADLEDIPTTVTVTAPPGWRVVAGTARLVASGATLPVRLEGNRAHMAVALSGDTVLNVQLASP